MQIDSRGKNIIENKVMRRILLSFVICLLICCENRPSKTETIINTKSKSFDTIRYTTYYFLYDNKNAVWNTFVEQFLQMDNQGNCILARTENGSLKFFKAHLPDTLLQLIGTIMELQKIDTSYTFNSEKGYIYDGATYLLDFQSSDKRSLIEFIPPEAPKEVQLFSNALDSFILSVKQEQTGKYDFSAYVKEIQRLALKKNVLPPPERDTSKFVPIKLDSKSR
jgi:hypothetical protein